MWSFSCWKEGEIERDPELRAGRALKELDGWPEEVSHSMFTFIAHSRVVVPLSLRLLAGSTQYTWFT